MRNGVSSIFAYIIINVVLTLRTKDYVSNGAPSSLDLVLGIVLISIIIYWVVRIRILERQPLSHSIGQLLLCVFMVWSFGVTIVGFSNDHNSINNAIREILNLSPLLILPILYERFIEPGSKIESVLFIVVIVSAALILSANILKFRSNVAHAIMLYQVNRAFYDQSLTMFILLLMTSSMMRSGRWWQTLSAIAFFLFEMVGLIITFTRNSYVSTPLAMMVVLWLGNAKERFTGTKRLVIAICIGGAVMLQIYLSSRVIRLLLLAVGKKLLSAGNIQTDRSLRMRYTEWRDEGHAILQSPILGHGFGTSFRTYDIVFNIHSWISFSHSSYLYIIFKTGFLGALLFFGAYFTFMYKGLKLARAKGFTPRSRLVLRACFAFLIIVLFQAYLGPVLDSKTSMIWVGLVWGYYLALEKQVRNGTMVSQ
jgi:O-antigen ligase